MKGRAPARWLCAIVGHRLSDPIFRIKQVCRRCDAVVNVVNGDKTQ